MTTKGEALIAGLDQIREGLDMIARLGNRNDLLRSLVGSQAATQRLKDLMKSNNVLFNLVLGMVKARNSRLSEETVNKVVIDFLDILFDLSKPYRDETATQEAASNKT
ncbi:MAG: hypothetical protein K6U04_01550 [Armatimonadetes bacterium]|nr:hypothetical protein [Armatimonadota bacterium]